MTSPNAREPAGSSRPWLPLLACAALGLAACSGDSGKTGSAGPTGPGGPPGAPPSGGVPVETANLIKASIVSASVPDDGRPVIEVRLANELNQPLEGLTAGGIRFVLARLEPGVNGKSSTWHAVTRRAEAGTTNQGYSEAGTAGEWVPGPLDNGVYTYRFAKSLEDDQIPYDGSLVHRVGLEVRVRPAPEEDYIPANNAVFDWIPALNSAVAQSGREIVDNDTCNACHDNLAFHGGTRFDLQYCVMCHESYSSDAQSGNTIDLKVMIHKIHRGHELPSVVAGGSYGIYGYGDEFTDYSHVVYPQDQRNCQTCHEENDADTPQASNWRITVNREVCGSCHDLTNFDTGENHAGVAATDDQCVSCHGPDSHVADLKTQVAHVIPAAEAATRFEYQVLQVVDTAPGQAPTVTIRVVDPTNGDAPYDIRAAGGPFQNSAASLAVDLAWSTQPDFTNTGSGSATPDAGTPAQPVRIDFKANGVPDPDFDGAFRATSATAIPAGATGSGAAIIEGRPGVDVTGDGVPDRIAVTSVGMTFAITDAEPVDYDAIVDIAKCNDCHQQLTLHGDGRTNNAELCASCHNPNATDINRRVDGSPGPDPLPPGEPGSCVDVAGTDDQTIDFKYMVHAIHRGEIGAYKVCGYNNTGYDFSHVKYPGKINNCEGCHLPGTYYPPAPGTAIATTIDAGPDRSTPEGDIAITPVTAVCSACHKTVAARNHMELSGGSFDAVKAADSTTPGVPVEACGTCHGEGRSADVKVMHGVGEFNYN